MATHLPYYTGSLPIDGETECMKLAAMPKCYMDAMGISKTMSVFEWIDIAKEHLLSLGVTGLEMHPGFLANFSPTYLAEVRAAVEEAGFVIPFGIKPFQQVGIGFVPGADEVGELFGDDPLNMGRGAQQAYVE